MNARPHPIPLPQEREKRAPIRGGRHARAIALAVCLIVGLAWAVRADDTITNVMSPLVSYQYLEAPAGAGGSLMSPIVSYQYFDSLGDAVSWQSETSPTASYFYQIGSEPAPILLHGRLTDAGGAALPGATVSAMVGLTPAAQATTDASGAYQFPSVGAGVYVLTASAAGHQSSLRVLTLGAATAQQDFQLAVLPAAPSVRQTTRQPPSAFTQPPVGPMGSTLRIFDGTAFAAITPANAPSPNLMTIVLTHGWVPHTPDPAIVSTPFEEWPLEMAKRLLAAGVTAEVANIVAWDWRYAASDPPPAPSDAVDRTPDQGVALGKALLSELMPAYSQPIHFLGHSLGAIVNAAAINYLHGERIGAASQDISPTKWTVPIHVTLFDQAQIAEFGGRQVLYDGLDPTVLDAWNAAFADNSTTLNWQPPLPLHFTWADNYISVVGFSLTGAVNAWLQKGVLLVGPVAAHGYPLTWYNLSIADPTDSANPLGFQNSYEYDQVANLPSSAFPPSVPQVGSTYHQVPSAADELALEPLPPVTRALGLGADYVVQGTTDVIQYAGDVKADIENNTQPGQWISQGFDYAGSVAAQGAQTLVGLWNSASLQLTFHTLPPSPLKDGSGGPPMAWVPLVIPTNVAAMAFDFTVAGDPVDDVIVCGLGTNNLFSLEAKYVPTNGVSASRLIDVTAWMGATNELFFGLMGGTSTNATVQIENIRFYSLQPPQLQIANAAGGTVRLTWPATAGGYVVETATALAAADWTALTNAPTLTADRYTLTNGASDAVRFFRLRPR